MAQNGYYLESDPSIPTVVVTENSSSSIDGIAVDPENAGMVVGDKLQLTPTIVPEDANVAPEWSSTESDVAVVDENGLVTALATGHTYIVCKVSDVTAVCNVKVYGPDDVPDIPEVEGITESSITLTSVAGLQYRINDETWSNDSIITGLEPDTEYNVSVRLAANSYHKASEAATTTVRTADHSLIKVDGKEATCDEDGNIAYWICTDCGRYFGDEEATEELDDESVVIPASGHDFSEWTTTKEATCTETGLMERACSLCDETETITIKATGHKWGNDISIDVEPTYSEEGIGSIHCKYCDAIKPDSEVTIPVLEKPDEWLQAIADKNAAITAKETAEASLLQAQANLATAQETIAELNETIESKDATIEQKEEALLQAQNDLTTANEALNQAQADLQTANSQLDDARARIAELQETLEDKEEELSIANMDLVAALAELSETNELLEAATTNYNNTLAELEIANATIKDIHTT